MDLERTGSIILKTLCQKYPEITKIVCGRNNAVGTDTPCKMNGACLEICCGQDRHRDPPSLL